MMNSMGMTMLARKMLLVSVIGIVAGCMTVDEMLASDNPVFRAIGESQTVIQAVDASRQHTAEERAAAVNKLDNQDRLVEIVISQESTAEVKQLALGKITEQKAVVRIAAEVESEEIAAQDIALIKEDNVRIDAGHAAFLKNHYQRAERIIRGVEAEGLIADKIRESMNEDEKLKTRIAAGDFKTRQDRAAVESARALNYRFGMILIKALRTPTLIASLLDDQLVTNKYSSRNGDGIDYYDPLVSQYVKTLDDQKAYRDIVLGKTEFKGYAGKDDLKKIALEMITDDQILGEMFLATRNLDLLERIRSAEVLKRIFQSENGVEISEQTLSKIGSQEFIVDLASNANAMEVRSIAIGLVKDPEVKRAAQKSFDDEIAAKKAAEEKAAAERRAAQERAAAERRAAQERAAAERKARLDAFERELPAKIAECDEQFHFRIYTKCPATEKRLKTFVVLKHKKQGLTDSQIRECLMELDERMREIPAEADAAQQNMVLTAICNSMHPLGGTDFIQEMEKMQQEMERMQR